jgi:anti-sigma-K factor RskA
MTEDAPLSPRDTDDALAAEYVLGVLALPDRMAAEARLKSDPAFAAQVAAWEARLSPLNADYAEAAPPPDMLGRIEARLFPAPPPRRRGGLFGWLAGAATAAALGLATLAVLPVMLAPPLVAVLGEGDALRFEARFAGGALTVTRVAGQPAPQGQVQELWLIAPDAAPVSLGLLTDAALSVPYPELPAGWTLAVSVEPAGGSPTGGPTGPVVAAGVVGDI